MKVQLVTVISDDLGLWRRQLLRILDQLDGRRSRDLGPAARIARLGETRRIPRHIVVLMKVILEFRNLAEYEAWEPSRAEGEAAKYAWAAVCDWWGADQVARAEVA